VEAALVVSSSGSGVEEGVKESGRLRKAEGGQGYAMKDPKRRLGPTPGENFGWLCGFLVWCGFCRFLLCFGWGLRGG